jgi:hypothetical protein
MGAARRTWTRPCLRVVGEWSGGKVQLSPTSNKNEVPERRAAHAAASRGGGGGGGAVREGEGQGGAALLLQPHAREERCPAAPPCRRSRARVLPAAVPRRRLGRAKAHSSGTARSTSARRQQLLSCSRSGSASPPAAAASCLWLPPSTAPRVGAAAPARPPQQLHPASPCPHMQSPAGVTGRRAWQHVLPIDRAWLSPRAAMRRCSLPCLCPSDIRQGASQLKRPLSVGRGRTAPQHDFNGVRGPPRQQRSALFCPRCGAAPSTVEAHGVTATGARPGAGTMHRLCDWLPCPLPLVRRMHLNAPRCPPARPRHSGCETSMVRS